MCNPCQEGDHHAQGHPIGQEDPRREGLIAPSIVSWNTSFLYILYIIVSIHWLLHLSSPSGHSTNVKFLEMVYYFWKSMLGPDLSNVVAAAPHRAGYKFLATLETVIRIALVQKYLKAII